MELGLKAAQGAHAVTSALPTKVLTLSTPLARAAMCTHAAGEV
jgi:hypothetical protein